MTATMNENTQDRPSTRPGISDRPLTPPNAVPRHVRPVTCRNISLEVNISCVYLQPTNWKLGIVAKPSQLMMDEKDFPLPTYGRVEISCPAAATPIMVETPHPLWQASSAALITFTYINN